MAQWTFSLETGKDETEIEVAVSDTPQDAEEKRIEYKNCPDYWDRLIVRVSGFIINKNIPLAG